MATVAEFFATRKNQFHKNILGRITRGNPFRAITPMSPFDLNEGDVPTVITQTHMLPTGYPTSMTQIATPTVQQGASDATTAPGCNPTPTTIQTGHNERTFRLYGASFDTPEFCLSDMKRKHQIQTQVQWIERALSNYTSVFWGDYHRIKNIGMLDNKMSTLASGALDTDISTDEDHSGLTTLPAIEATWDHLRSIYWDLVRMGVADEMAIGSANGQPVIPVVMSPAYINKLTEGNDRVWETINYHDPKSNLKALGIRSIYGMALIPDLFPIRYGDIGAQDGATTAIDTTAELVAANMIYPTVNVSDVTTGVRHKPNPEYKTVANGGKAEYEVITFLPKGVWECKYESVDPSSFGSKMKFNPKTDYIGTFNFINNPTFRGTNDRANMGYYLADIRAAAKPVYTDLGVTLLTKALD